MSRLIAVCILGCFALLGVVLAGEGRVVSHNFYYPVSVDYDTVGDTVDDGRNYYDFLVPILGNAEVYRAGKFRVIVHSASPALSGFGASDSAFVELVTKAANIVMFMDTVTCASIPCTAAFTWAPNDTLYGNQIYANVRAVDSTADTAFTTTYMVTVEGIFRGY